MAFVLPSAPRVAPPRATPARVCATADVPSPPPVSRRAVLFAAVAAAAVAAANAAPVPPAEATVEYAGVPFLGGSEVVDINNANVRAFMKYPGMYPTLAGKIATHGPYAAVEDVMNIPGLTSEQKELLNKYKNKMVALRPTPEYVSGLSPQAGALVVRG
ncbi:hypothetical protein MMPV_001258 [Pyropia vietnamensis]